MSRQRRHAEDFTDSLNSFNHTTGTDTVCSKSQDSLDQIKECNFLSNRSTRSSKHSLILAGSYTKSPLILDTSTTSVKPAQSVPDLNKCIDLFQNDSLKEEFASNSKFNHICMKGDALMSTSSKTKKRDTNYNIHRNKSEKNLIKSTPKSWPTETNCKSRNINISNAQCEYDQEAVGTDKFERILCSLDNQLNKIKEASQTESVLKRLSQTFMTSPKNFTQQLMTIIEESVTNNGDDTCNVAAFNLSRLTTEFRKMCKFIEDESWPDWAPSLSSTNASLEGAISPENNKFDDGESRKEKLLSRSMSIASLPSTPLSATCVLKKRFFQKISKNRFSGSVDNVTNLSPNISSVESFERLEAHCKKLFPEEKESSDTLHRSLSMPSLLSMSYLEDICDQQMASLNSSDACNKDKIIFSTPNLHNKCLEQSLINKLDFKCTKLQQESDCKSTDSEYDNISYSKKRSIRFNKRSEFSTINTDKITSDYRTFDTDELEKTLLQDIAEKRKRCLDTARLITEINANTNVVEEKKSLGESSLSTITDSDSSVNNEAEFLKTLMSCKDYLTYLERQKPIFNLFKKLKPSTPKTPSKSAEEIIKNIGAKNSTKECSKTKSCVLRKSPLNPNGNIYNIRNSPLSREMNKDNTKKLEQSTPKLFVTPGKSPQTLKYKRKKEYFPNICSPPKNGLEEHILKSPHAKGLYRLNYNTIVSPVGMYIRGTDMQLIKNVHAKTDDMLLTPTRKTIKPLPGGNSKSSIQKALLKLNLSPKLGVNQMHKQEVIVNKENSNTPKSHFILPKVSYELPSRVKTIKEMKTSKVGNRVQKLMESAQSKVVIRHEGLNHNISRKLLD
ncbi:uncharacterized protein LOC143258961 isoform X2 [Megalopta genalis]|uniref:uncharacterized protein LOC143258961 isoform X2 n=1 Tax=Megalopta genalis TaxID=115081 RepID=UPI003FD31776